MSSLLPKPLLPTTVLLLLVAFICAQQEQQKQQQLQRRQQQENQCRICGGLGPVPQPLKTLPEKYNIPLQSCFELETAASLLEDGSEICDAIQAFASFCECNLPPGSCALCWDGSNATNLDTTLENYPASDFLGGFGADTLLDCEALESFLKSTSQLDSEQCMSAQIDVGEVCGCPPIPSERVNNATDDNVENSQEQEPTEQQNDARTSCSLCRNGTPAPWGDKLIDIGTDPLISCSEWELIGLGFKDHSDDCEFIRYFGRICGCPPQPGECSICPLGEPVPRPDYRLNWLNKATLSTPTSAFKSRVDSGNFTCELMETFLAPNNPILPEIFSIDEGLVCTAMQMKSWICGCRPDWKPIVLTWCYRISAMLSFVVGA